MLFCGVSGVGMGFGVWMLILILTLILILMGRVVGWLVGEEGRKWEMGYGPLRTVFWCITF